MTYPQYQPPQGYAPQAPYQQPSYPGPAYPQTPQAPYGQQTSPAPAPQMQQQGQALTPPVPNLRDGSGGAGGAGTPAPKFRHLLGRTIIVEPVRVDEDAMDTSTNPPTKRPEAYFHLTVVDGGPVQYGDSQDRDVSKQRPNTHESDTPARWTNVNDRSFGFVRAVRDALAAGEAGHVGVVQQGTKGNKPYLITKCGTDVHGNARPDGDARYAAAMEIFGKIWQSRHGGPPFVSPEPRSLVAPPAAAPQQVAYGQYPAAAAPQQYATSNPADPAAQHWAQQAYTAPQQPAYGAPTGPGGMYMPQSAPPAPAPAVQLPPAVEAWLATLPPELAAQQREQFMARGMAGLDGSAGPGI